MEQTLRQFICGSLYDASNLLLDKLHIQHTQEEPTPMRYSNYFDGEIPQYIQKALALADTYYYIGEVCDEAIQGTATGDTRLREDLEKLRTNAHYQSMMLFAIDLKPKAHLTRTDMAVLTRAFNRLVYNFPVTVIFRQGHLLSIGTCERTEFKQEWRQGQGEKLGRVIILRNIDCKQPNRAHLDILGQLNAEDCTTFDDLYRKWMTEFDISLLNKQFYKELQEWFYWAVDEVELPLLDNSNQDEDLQAKNFIVRMLSRLMFCWFIKERGLIDKRLLELTDFNQQRYKIVRDTENEDFLDSNSYYRGILQNVFFNGLNKQKKSAKKDFKCLNYLPEDFDYQEFTTLPFLNCGTFDPLEEDFNKESIEDDVISVPNRLFYGDESHRGINQIFCSYHFTIEENTPLDIDIALDPEMLGLVFENLLAEIDPNNDDATAKSIRKATGSYYTPRPVIQSMVNESLLVFLKKRLAFEPDEHGMEFLADLIYHDKVVNDRHNRQIVESLSNIRVLDPACGSGAFPMGMLQRVVELLRLVDPDNSLWLDIMLEPIKDRSVRENFKKQLASHQDDYSRKLGIIQNCIYGIDIQPIAVQITKLRFFISLLIDQKINREADNAGVTPLPNLETKIVCADSLKSLSADVFEEKLKEQMIRERERYYQPDVSAEERREIAGRIADLLDVLYPTFAIRVGLKQVSNKAILKKWFMTGSINAPFFDMKTFFPEIDNGFDIVIGNPPYGGFKIDDDVKEHLGLGNKDPYGAFIARFLGNGSRVTPLKNGGVLAFIVSDTFMTIGTHLKLRQQMMHNIIYKMVRMSPKTFSATVNTVVIVCEKCRADATDSAIEGNICQMADMSNIDIHYDFEHFMNILSKSTMQRSNISNEEYAIYNYEQKLIKNCSNLPFFVASPKLFELMNDVHPRNKYSKMDNLLYSVRQNAINGKEKEFCNFGDISEVRQGLATANNKAYLFQEPEARGNYRSIVDYRDKILSESDLENICQNEELRMDIVAKGISKFDKMSKRYFGGRYVIPYDKGGESDSNGGWLPNYYVPTSYYIDWSEWAVNRMMTLTVAQRIVENGEKKKITEKDKRTIAAVIRNPTTYFKKGIAFSWTGAYSPTFRINAVGPYDHGASAIFTNVLSSYSCVAILASKLIRYIERTYINHTVNFGIDDIKKIPIVITSTDQIEKIVKHIIAKQEKDRYYDYASHEQLEIDRWIYEAYGLNEEDVKEVETWFARRYPKLAAAQRNNLEKLSKA